MTDDSQHPVATPPAVRILDAHGSLVGLMLPERLTFNEWQRIGVQLDVQQNASLWWIADWAAYGDRHYRRDYGEALEQVYSRQSLHDLAYVARNVESSRRRENLSFTHHREVAALEPDWQKVWLDDAETQGWSTRELRERIAEWRGANAPVRPAALTFRAVGDLHDLCVQAAERMGLDPADWARQTLEHAARLALANV